MSSWQAQNRREGSKFVPVCLSRILAAAAAAAILAPTIHCLAGEPSLTMTWPARPPRKQRPTGRDHKGPAPPSPRWPPPTAQGPARPAPARPLPSALSAEFGDPIGEWQLNTWYCLLYSGGTGGIFNLSSPTSKRLATLNCADTAGACWSAKNLIKCRTVVWSSTDILCCLAQSCPTLLRSPGSSVHGILRVRLLDWIAISSCWGSSPHMIEPVTPNLRLYMRFLYSWAIGEAPSDLLR